ncbi:MAG: dihydrolipoyl dehydrogenase [Myxococcales bacterium]|nr:dihydrolipoyl dehydrogenase [Myxococcales bacterium]
MVMGSLEQQVDVVVVGSGPGGYVAAMRAADLGHEVTLVEARERRGGVCLLEGCIPSKALISTVELAHAARDAAKMGLTFKDLEVDHEKLRGFKEKVVAGLSGGIDFLLKKRGVEVITARARFDSGDTLFLDGGARIKFNHCILAVGSRPSRLPPAGELELWSSTEALELREIPGRLLVVGGGYIGLELGFVYAGLGSKVSVVELLPGLLMGADRDLVKFVDRKAKKRFEKVMLGAKVTKVVEAPNGGYRVSIESDGKVTDHEYDRVLVAVGRRPNTDNIGLENTKIEVDKHGLIQVDQTMRTAEPRVFAIGDIVPGPGLAHKAMREGKVAAEVINGKPSAADYVSVPAIVFTDPEVAWVGLTEDEAKAQGRDVHVGRFPLTALGRAKTIDRTDGMSKVISDAQTGLVLGVGVVGPHASELIAEATLALEMGATVEDIAATIHPHPTLSESVGEAAEVAEGVAVHIYPPTGM